MRISVAVVLFLLGTLSANELVAQVADSVDTREIYISTNWPEAAVEVDGEIVGIAQRKHFSVSRDVERVRLVPPSGGGWDIRPVEVAIGDIPGDTLDILLDFPYHYKFESAPYGAEVLLEGSEGTVSLGATPFLYKTDTPLSDYVTFSLTGFLPESVEPGSAMWNRHVVELRPENLTDVSDHIYYGESRRKHRWWIDAAAVSTALAAGALAVHYKFKADNRFDEYTDTGNPDLQPQINRYDDYSTASLVVMEAGIALFAIRLILR